MFYVLPQTSVMTSVIPFEQSFPSGVMRGRVNPVDGQVYLSGLRGWGTVAKDDGCVNRVRFTGRSAFMVQNVELIPKGLRLTFSEPLNVAFGSDVKSYTIEQWNYLYSEKYGSPEFSVRDPKKIAHDRLTVNGVSLSEDGRVVTLDVPEMAVADQMKTTLDLRSRTGDVLKVNVFSTVHRLLK